MAIGGNKTGKKKITQRKNPDPYLKKEWYPVIAPAHFKSRHIGQTPVTKTAGLRVATDVINHRVYEVNLGDLNPGAEELNGNTKFYLQTQLVSDGKCLTNFHGMDITRHKYGSLFRKGCDCIDVFMDIPTTDGYLLRVFVIAFTDRFRFQRRKNCHVKGRVIRMMRAGIYETLHNGLGKVSIPVLVTKLSNFEVNAKLTEALQKITMCRDVMIRRVKVVKRPRNTMELLSTMHDSNQVRNLAEGQSIQQ